MQDSSPSGLEFDTPGLESVVLRKRQEAELEVAEVKISRFSLAVMKLDRIRNECI